ncbi:hypothetical protein U5801_00915 [Lamprobacter modestohalophilus]|uniref:hypothetical protein n=1 Tax=Lamprobacter modestohalophilus TaxID=1064514 RepID=UPI002ADEFAFF|nr:hypothetical protein [Lamprobacter modestohalophilus]MEA1048384.1 hypothetical protein [Lamprobacter modestohalophilus]
MYRFTYAVMVSWVHMPGSRAFWRFGKQRSAPVTQTNRLKSEASDAVHRSEGEYLHACSLSRLYSDGDGTHCESLCRKTVTLLRQDRFTTSFPYKQLKLMFLLQVLIKAFQK